MNKAEEMREKFNADVALFIRKDDVLYAYLLQDNFAVAPGKLKACNTMTPDDYRSIRQERIGSDADADGDSDSDSGQFPSQNRLSCGLTTKDGPDLIPPLSPIGLGIIGQD